MVAQDDKTFSTNALLKDIDQFESFLSAHPDLYTHNSEMEFEKAFEDLRLNVEEPLTALEFYRKVAPIVAMIKDGHSSTYLPKKWLENKRKEHGAFPYEMFLTNDNALYILKSLNKGPIPTGAKIHYINGISVDSFISMIDPCISYELSHFRNTTIDEEFEKHLYVAFGSTSNTEITYSVSDTVTEIVENMPFVDWKNYQKDNREEREIRISQGDPYSYSNIGKGVGHLTIYAFSALKMKSYEVFLADTFRDIKKDSIHSLIIDVRGNFGGWPKISSQLFHYISDTHFKTMGKSSMKISEPYKNYWMDRYPVLRSAKPFIQQRRHYVDINAIIRGKNGDYVHEELYFNEDPREEKHEFNGDCYLLTNRDSYSAASSFASTFQCYQMGPIIGEETGGTKIFRANAIHDYLSKSGIWISLSTTKLSTTCYDQELQGILPTIEYSPSVIEVMSGMDTQLLYTQRIIKKVQKEKASN